MSGIVQGGLLVDGVLASCNVAAAGASDADFAAALAPVRAAYAQVPCIGMNCQG